MRKQYLIVSRYLDGDRWKCEEEPVLAGTLEEAWRTASRYASGLDAMYGDSHFWTVDLKNPQGESYVQLFHGRLS